MLAALRPDRSAVEADTPSRTPIITTLYDLIAALSAASAPGEEDLVTAAVADLCHTARLRFLAAPHARVIVDAGRDGHERMMDSEGVTYWEDVHRPFAVSGTTIPGEQPERGTQPVRAQEGVLSQGGDRWPADLLTCCGNDPSDTRIRPSLMSAAGGGGSRPL